MNPFEIQIAFAFVALGFYFFVGIAWKQRKSSYRLKNFFLGGGDIGAEPTENNTLGNTFAWSGGTWFFVIVAYTFGPWVILLQIPWCLSIIFIALLFTRIHRVTKNKTIHGFLDDSYGSKVRKAGSIATTLGYIFNAGFEIYWSSLLLVSIFGKPELALPIAIIFAILTGIYCSIGGFRANVATDKPQNLLGVFSLALLSLFVCFSCHSYILKLASIVFSFGSLLYILLSTFQSKLSLRFSSRGISYTSIILAGLAIIISVALSSFSFGNEIDNKVFISTPMPIHLIIGLIAFQLIFNIVDMANWQSIAANGEINESEHGHLKWAIIRSALYLNWFPAFGGALIGLALRSLSNTGITDNNIFHFAFEFVMPDADFLTKGIMYGVLLLGFISTTLSTADTYLMSAAQTLVYDLLHHEKIVSLLNDGNNVEEEKVYVKKAKRLLIPLTLIMVITFWGSYELYSMINGNAIDFQMIMYSFAVSLFVPVMYALFMGHEKAKSLKTKAFSAIVGGILAAIIPYTSVVILGVESETRSVVVNLTPLYSLFVSFLMFFGLKNIFTHLTDFTITLFSHRGGR